MQNCKARRGAANPHADFWGSEKVEKNPLAIMGALNAHRNLVREMGPQCRCAARNATVTRVGVRACGALSLHMQPATDRNARHKRLE